MFTKTSFVVFSALLLVVSLFTVSTFAQEQGLDSEKGVVNAKRGTPIQGTVILRIDTRDNSLSKLDLDQKLKSETDAQKTEAQKLVAQNEGQFQVLGADHVKSELDRDAGTSSFYFHYRGYGYGYRYGGYGYPGSYYYPTYYGYGYAYAPYYYYNYGYYNYYCYGNPYYGYGW